MSAASASSWPGSRALLGWWRVLQDRQPRQMWFGRLTLHRLEAAFDVAQRRMLDRWQRALLHLLASRLPQSDSPESLLADLHVDRPLLGQCLREWIDAGFLRQNDSGSWDLTDAGRRALETGQWIVRKEERRTLHFLDNATIHRPPQFLPLLWAPYFAASCQPSEMADVRFEIAVLEACIRQTLEWKARHQFPTDVEALLASEADWRRVVVDSAAPVAFVFLRTGEATALGFAVRAEGWTLEPEPIVTLAEGWQEILPDLAVEPPPEAWREAWRTWGQPRGLSLADVESCRLKRVDHRLLVHAPPRIVERLHAMRSDAIKQEAWLLAGDGRLRCAAQVDLRPLDGSDG